MRYLSYLLWPLVVGGAVYSLLYTAYRSWYSWIINSLVNGKNSSIVVHLQKIIIDFCQVVHRRKKQGCSWCWSTPCFYCHSIGMLFSPYNFDIRIAYSTPSSEQLPTPLGCVHTYNFQYDCLKYF